MDPVTISAVLGAVAGGAGGSLGSQLWTGLVALIRRPLQRDSPAGSTPLALVTGDSELAGLRQQPADQRLAVALAEILVARAEADGAFRQAFEAWWAQASHIEAGGDVTNEVSGGTFQGPVLQGRDFTGLTFGSAAPAPPVSPPPGRPDFG